MNRLINVAAVLLSLQNFAGAQRPLISLRQTEDTSLRFLSYNVRYDSQPNNISVQQTIDSLPQALPSDPAAYYPNVTEQPWSTRRIKIANDILFNEVDVYGGQELLKRQVDDVQELLGDEWDWIGVGRDDGKEAGEYAAIFFDTNSVTLLDWDTFWLTDTPFDVSKYPDAGSYRVATTAHFSTTSGNFTMIDTHLDDQSDGQRRLGLSLILHRAKYEAIKTKRPVVLTGDFNSPTSDGAYQIITGAATPLPLNETFLERYNWTTAEEQGFSNFTMLDLLGQAPPRYRSGNFATFTGFVNVSDTSDYSRIDYIMAGSNGGWASETYHVGPNLDDDGIYHSDHRPVYADLTLKA